MKTKILLSLATITVVVGLVGGATWALFTASGSVAGNTIATGTLLLAVNKGDGKPVSITNMKPGDVDATYRWFDAYNYGTLEAEYYLRMEYVSGNVPLYNALEVELRDGGYTGACDGPAIWSGPIKNITGSALRELISDNNVHATEGDGVGGPDNIHAGWTQRVCQKFTLPSTADNSLQGKSVTFDEWVDAEQDND